jgi:LacI family transcriptional regulator
MGLCLDAGISVPGSIAILGTDNDEVLCESVSPSLSSISLDGRNAGMLCAQLLDRHMRRRKVEPLIDLAFPRVVTRQSTDEMQVPDPFLAKALAIVRKDLSTTHTVAELAAAVGVSKRTLEMKSNLVLGATLKTEIDRIRLNEAVRLISNTALSIQSIAEKCGFCCASHLNTRFKTIFGHNPSVFRYQDPK